MEMNSSQFGRHIKNMSLAKLTLQATGTYNTVFHRPYQTHTDNNNLGMLQNRINDFGPGRIDGSLMSGLAVNLIAPSATPCGEVIIPNGWSERRIRFFMEVHVETSLSPGTIYYIQGYTNYPGVSSNGAVDPHMQFIINSVTTTVRNNVITPMGMQVSERIKDSSQIITDPNYIGYDYGDPKYLVRPVDICNGMIYNDLMHGQNVIGGMDRGYMSHVQLTKQLARSNRNNNIPTNYLATTVDGYRQAVVSSGYGTDSGDLLSRAKSQFHDTTQADTNPFIKAISDIRGNYIGGNMFTYGELERIFPNAALVTNYLQLGQTQLAQLHTAGSTNFWTGSDRLTVVSTTLSNAIPAMMMDLMIAKIHFLSTNHDINGRVNTTIVNAMSMANIDLTRNYEVFKNRLERELIADFTFNNQESFTLEMHCDLFGETWVTLSLGSEPATTFVTPSFSDHLLSPIICPNRIGFENMVQDFTSVYSAVVETNAQGAINSIIENGI